MGVERTFEKDIVRGVSCVLLGSTEAALMGIFTPISCRPAKCAMAFPWIHSGARSAPLCTEAVLMAHFAGRREIGVKFPMRAASVDPNSTQLTPLTITKAVQSIIVCYLMRPECTDSRTELNGNAGNIALALL